ncbi:hypothetical protein JIG36_00665 [Actinoplanes sp. LDG1-06]|uniref:Uncharacterized protein n=1 Tax=Paractinoplanes ovalisporus TaxID=2810368 RepID=A0ABS2A2J6_9ACTN|nr:hypothetical protein [Actinoplanes ovalisporus]MBM2614066.1 hypothetical protein [Actinoplanes ovalisporus]
MDKDEEKRARQERFGRLPARVLPQESVDVRTVPERPASAMSAAQTEALLGGG